MPLFDRLGKRIMLTDAGRRLLPFAQEIANMHVLAKEALRSQNELVGTLKIGAPESLAAFRLPEIIREFRERYPQMKIILKPGACWELNELVASGELDLAFSLQPETEFKDLHIETLIQEPMALIAPKGHRLEHFSFVQPADLKEEIILHTESGCTYRALFESYLNRHGIFPDPNLEFWSIEAIKQCVINGLGISFLPRVTVESELQEGKLIQLAWDDVSQRVSTQVAYRMKKWKSPAFDEFLQIVQKHASVWRSELT
ncbi:DNA-binding transcriptional regulator, LysR family [Fontibacillus panacisegetis]|uniref:DNA-binding transcriptional regulator, LysR family n=1 Tax=Fontibacillus panacisegetis TaxID=670482 RepID=A0A1G7E8Q1_9BACL|nr:DNA-binding transcriptional regulator, LysR family [Fontibacillus panacisegetis]